jgi:lipid A 3-O-deacylase
MTDRPRMKPRAIRGLLLAVALVPLAGLAPLLALAQTPDQPPADHSSIWTLQGENASISTENLTDRYYTNGLRLGWTSGTDMVPDALERLAYSLWGDGQRRISFDLTQQIYTPADTAATVPPPGDRPYAGVLLGNFGLTQDTDNRRTMIGFSVGMLGPWAQGEEVQNGFHDLIGQAHTNGWSTQLNNEPVFEFTSAGTWRLNTGTFGPFETQALPALTVGLGTLRVYAETGVTLRIGQGLDEDFGVARLLPGLTGGDTFVRTRNFGWYVFVGADGQAVAHDVTVEGNTWVRSDGAQREPYVGEAQAGFALLAFGTRLTYTQVVQTNEFKRQRGGLHQFGSLALSVRF